MTEIINEQNTFYEHLYTSKKLNNIENIEEQFLNTDNIPKLSEIEKNDCEDELSILECTKALKMLPNNKSPGADGFTT